jgi:hypothetical protein
MEDSFTLERVEYFIASHLFPDTEQSAPAEASADNTPVDEATEGIL